MCAESAYSAALGTHGLKAALLIETVSSIAVISTQVGAAILPITIHDSHTLLSPKFKCNGVARNQAVTYILWQRGFQNEDF